MQPEARGGHPVPQRATSGKGLRLSPGKVVTPLGREHHRDLEVLVILLSETVLSHFQRSLGPAQPLGTFLLSLGATAPAQEVLFGWLGSPASVITILQLFLRLCESFCVWALTFFSFLQKELEKSHFWVLYLVQPFDKGRGWLCSRRTVLVALDGFTLDLGPFKGFEAKRKGHVQQLQHCHQVMPPFLLTGGLKGAEMMEMVHAMKPRGQRGCL